MKTDIILFLLCSLLSSTIFGQEFDKRIIDQSVNYTTCVRTGDIDNDNDLDLIVAIEGSNKLVYYENSSLNWTMYPIGSLNGMVGAGIADFDGDGKLDIAASGYQADMVVWYKNKGGNPVAWEPYIIDNTLDGAEQLDAGDIDGDGKPDVAVSGYYSGELVWYKNDLPGDWIKDNINTNLYHYTIFNMIEMNGDNMPDIVTGNEDRNKVFLYVNNLPGNGWSEIIVDDYIKQPFSTMAGDIDHDGDMDIASTSQGATGDEADIVWYENDGSEENWTPHDIDNKLTKIRGLNMADFDNDSKLDIVVTDNVADDIIIYFNKDGGQTWTKIKIDSTFSQPNPVFIYDIDEDNDLDIFPTSRTTNQLVWYENRLLDPTYAYACDLGINKVRFNPDEDSIIIRGKIRNPESHSVKAYTIIKGEQSAYLDTIDMFNDGLHFDENPDDSIWGNKQLLTKLSEDIFKLRMVTHDENLNIEKSYNSPDKFTTIEPVTFVLYTFTGSDTICNPGDNIKMYMDLKNNSLTADLKDVSAELSCKDSLIDITSSTKNFGDIAAGEKVTSTAYYRFSISDEWSVNNTIKFYIDISSEGYVFWQDSFSIEVLEPTIISDKTAETEFSIFPNPNNGIFTIQADNPGNIFLEVYNIFGHLIYQKDIRSSCETIDLSMYPEGIYFMNIFQNRGFSSGKLVIDK